jgi:hypothetical protein
VLLVIENITVIINAVATGWAMKAHLKQLHV